MKTKRKPLRRLGSPSPAANKANTLGDLITCVDYLALEAQRAGLNEAALLLGVAAFSLRDALKSMLNTTNSLRGN